MIFTIPEDKAQLTMLFLYSHLYPCISKGSRSNAAAAVAATDIFILFWRGLMPYKYSYRRSRVAYMRDQYILPIIVVHFVCETAECCAECVFVFHYLQQRNIASLESAAVYCNITAYTVYIIGYTNTNRMFL